MNPYPTALSPEQILYEDNHLLAVNKPAGLLTQGDRSGDACLLDLARAYLKEKYHKPGNVFVGMVHRLDKSVSGIVVLARTSKGASRLSEEIRQRRFQKTYQALVEGSPPQGAQRCEDRIERVGYGSRIAPGGQQAILTYRVLQQRKGKALLEINLETGRHHQIRVQLAHRGYPLLGDTRYGPKQCFGANKQIALHASRVSFKHPTRDESLTLEVPLPPAWQAFGS